MLSDSSTGDATVEGILAQNEIDPSVYRIGPSQVSQTIKFLNLFYFLSKNRKKYIKNYEHFSLVDSIQMIDLRCLIILLLNKQKKVNKPSNQASSQARGFFFFLHLMSWFFWSNDRQVKTQEWEPLDKYFEI